MSILINAIAASKESKIEGIAGNTLGSSSYSISDADSEVQSVQLARPGIVASENFDEEFWDLIINNDLYNFKMYSDFIDDVLCLDKQVKIGTQVVDSKQREIFKNRSSFVRSDEYSVIKFATELYMLKMFGIPTNSLPNYVGTGASSILPYYQKIVDKLDDFINLNSIGKDACSLVLSERLRNPFLIELIWNYWMEQGFLVQAMNLISMRFQNVRGGRSSTLLNRFDIDPLRPLSHILWGYIQDDQHRLSLIRRVYEYDHEYGLILTGKAVPMINPMDSRSKFLEAFHNLLNSCSIYYKEVDDTTRIADAFPILNNLKEVHLLLAEGNHNAYGNLTWTARHEMLVQQYILARPEMREFLGGRIMVPYNEVWMDRVDTIRNIQGYGDTSITYFYELAVYGEQILISIRFGDWSDLSLSSTNASNWALAFRNAIQRYTHAYRVVTGIDLSADQVQSIDRLSAQPAYLIEKRSMMQINSSSRISQRIPLRRLT